MPVGVGPGPAYRPPPRPTAVEAGHPVEGMRCTPARGPRVGAHLEIIVRGHVVAVPAGIGISPPLSVDESESRIQRGRCYYPAMTIDPTGLLELRGPVTLGELFAIWGQSLSATRVAGFHLGHERLVAYLDTKRWHADPRSIPLRRHTRVVLELASRIPPHRQYVFPPGL